MQRRAVTAALLFGLLALSACTSTPATTTSSAPGQTPTAAASGSPSGDTVPSAPATVQVQGDEIVITGRGNATASGVQLTGAYYLARVELTSSAPVASFMVFEADRDVPTLIATRTGTGVFRMGTPGVSALRIETDAAWELTLSPASTLGAPVATPQTWSGTDAEFVSPVVTVGDGANVSITYKGAPNPDAPSGSMAVLVLLYNSDDGTEALAAQYVNPGKLTVSEGLRPGKVFAIIKGAEAADAWEVTIS